MAIHLITDSTADLSEAQKAAWQVTVVPMGVVFGNETFLQDIDMTMAQFYARLVSSEKLPVTTQVNPEQFAACYAPLIAAGDEVIVLCLSAKLSGTYQSACMAREQFPGAPIHVIDTTTVTMGAALLLQRASHMRDAGASAREIVAEVEAAKRRTALYAIIDDLTYVHKGGRLSAVGYRVGGVLHLKPIVAIQDGVVKMVGIVRSMKRAYSWLADRVVREGIDMAYWVALGHTNMPILMEDVYEALRGVLTGCELLRQDVGMVVGTHAGPGAVALAYIKK